MVDQAVADGGWLILFGHEIGPEPGVRQMTHDEALRRLCGYCLDESHGIWLDTVAAVGAHIQDNRQGCMGGTG